MRCIGLLAKECSLTVSGRSNSQQVDSCSVFLCHQDSNSEVLISRQQYTVRHGSVTGECNHVGDNQRIHPFLFTSRIDETQPYLEIVQLG